MTITAPGGFRASGVVAGLKSSGAPDVALVVNDGPLDSAAAVFTSNRIEAAPVTWTRQVAKAGRLRAVVLNSGGANACTGPEGFADTHRSAEHVAELLGVGAGEVAVCSTGLIGVRLPMDRLIPGISDAFHALSEDGGLDAAEAICTTDTVPKQASFTTHGFTVAGMAKGAGMLAPSLATMLVVLTTDAVADPSALDASLREATRLTFDRLDSDGCQSTNDTVILMASGSSGITPAKDVLDHAILEVCAELAAQLLADAEGSSKDIAIEVVNARTEDDALEVGRSIARNNLLKCAVHGEDPNWGRVLAAVGTTKATFEPDAVDVAINGVWVCKGGSVGEDRSGVSMRGRRVDITVDLHAGEATATILTNDLTAAYVHENSAYAT